jgi:hypothetical protein
MITKETCVQIWNAWNEIDRANGLLNKMNEHLSKDDKKRPPELKNAFGDNNGLSLGIPISDSGTSYISGVSTELCVEIILQHISKQEKRLRELSAIAKIELYAPGIDNSK